MATFYQRTFCTTVGQLLAEFNRYFFNPMNAGIEQIFDVITIELDGFLGFEWSIPSGEEDITTIQVVCINALPENEYTIIAAILENGLRTIGSCSINNNTHPEMDFAAFEAWMTGAYLPTKLMILDAVLSSTVVVLDIASIHLPGPNIGTVSVVMQVTDGMTYYTVTDTYGAGFIDQEVVFYSNVMVNGTSIAAAPGQVGSSLAGIQEALEQIATLDGSISFNHGDTVFSVAGGIKTGT